MAKKRKTKPQPVKQAQPQPQPHKASVHGAEVETEVPAPELGPEASDAISVGLADAPVEAVAFEASMADIALAENAEGENADTVSVGEASSAAALSRVDGDAATDFAPISVDSLEASQARGEEEHDEGVTAARVRDEHAVDGPPAPPLETPGVAVGEHDRSFPAPHASNPSASFASTGETDGAELDATPRVEAGQSSALELDEVDIGMGLDGGESALEREAALVDPDPVDSAALPAVPADSRDDLERPASLPEVILDDYHFSPSEAHISNVSMLPADDDDLGHVSPSQDASGRMSAVTDELAQTGARTDHPDPQPASPRTATIDVAETLHAETSALDHSLPSGDDHLSPNGVAEGEQVIVPEDSRDCAPSDIDVSERIKSVVAEAGVADPSTAVTHASSAIPSPTATPVEPPEPEREPESSFYSRKPSIPASRPIAVPSSPDPSGGGASSSGQVDEDGFESMPISTSPPAPHAASPGRGAAGSPGTRSENGKRPSWASLSFGRRKSSTDRSGHAGSEVDVDGEGSKRRGSTPRTTVDGSEAGSGQSRADSPRKDGAEDGGKLGEPSKPRRHAPPAHPFPFPIPPSPRSSAKDLSEETAESGPPHAGPSNGADQPVSSDVKDHGIGVKGVSAFERVMNHTRPSHLPPKPREEDDTHYHQWEEMMATARKHEEERRRASEARKAERERRLSMHTPRWERLLSDSGFSVAGVQRDAELRRMWFEGVPTHLRGKAWSLAVGNPLARSKDAYRTYTARARKAIDAGRFPKDTLDAIERDMDATLPQLKLFVEGSPLRADLHELLCAWVVYRSDDGLGYAPYISHIAAMFLIPSPPNQAFLNLINFLSRPCPSAFVCEIKDEIEAFYRVLENLQADTFPKIFANCKNLGLRLPESYFRSVLVEQVPFEAVCRLWDQIMLDGDGYIFRASLAIFGFLEPRLYYPDKDEIRSVLEGTNRATAAITERERERARMRGEAYDEALDGRLSVFGLSEEALFGWLEQDGWREARYERLVVREMPD